MRRTFFTIYIPAVWLIFSCCLTPQTEKFSASTQIEENACTILIKFRDIPDIKSAMMKIVTKEIILISIQEIEGFSSVNNIMLLELKATNVSVEQLNRICAGLEKIPGIIQVQVYKK